ncbi:unnamed protein product [Lepeophtheirus salmonis]|uniref:(salmon louse) hypothetical protein n=1 Tax=Lepeophtheirus salmonis TaxID=72036 RepID=A0A7R8H9A1_LEPSM|nr:unnamed protein product [Lepeophtheirus salmonis]CAF2955430.1 unnamed protein product [Lepeophtheirus salmonis]
MTSAAMRKSKCKFTDELKKNPCFRLSRYALEDECMIYNAGTYVLVANKGGSDLEARMHSAKHKTAARGESSSSKVRNFFVIKADTFVTAAEGTSVFHIVKHHNSYISMDCTSGLLRKILPDSVTAHKISSARIETEVIVNAVIALHSVAVGLEALEQIPYCGVSWS